MFELTALKSAIHRITEEELRYIEGRLRYLDDKKSEEPSTKEEFYGSDRELHELIMKYSGNSRMVKFHLTLEAQPERLRRISSMTPMRLSKSRQEHLDILNALSDRDLDAATDALRPVSYTHLDVYKRQATTGSSTAPASSLWPASCWRR